MLTEGEDRASLARISRELIGRVEAIEAQQRSVLDRDSTELPVTSGDRRKVPVLTSFGPRD